MTSVVIPTYNRRRMLEPLLRPLLSDDAVAEVVVVVDGCRDGSIELLRAMADEKPRLVPLFVENRGENGARQAGVEAASSEVVLLLDDDVVAEPGLAEGHARHHAEEEGLVVLGYMPVRAPRSAPERLYAGWYEQQAADWERRPGRVLENLWAGNVSMRRADALRVGFESGFDKAYNPDRDFGLRCLKAGLRGRFDRTLRAEHRYERSFDAFRRDARNSGEGRAAIHRLHGGVVGPLAEDAFEHGLPGARRRLVRLGRQRPRATRPLTATLDLAARRTKGRAQDALALLLYRLEQQRAALADAPEPLPVTVVIPAYNRPEMARRAVESALRQTRPPAEVLVVDDCSTDSTGAVAAAAGARVVRHEVNRGEGGARNTGILEATQPWIALLDSDDEWLPHHLETLWALRGDHVLVGASAIAKGEAPEHHRIAGNPGPERVLRTPADLAFPENSVPPSAVMIRRDALVAAGCFDPSLEMCADLDCWLRVLEHGTGVSSPEVTAVYHVHGGQVSGDRQAMKHAHERVLERYADRPWYRRGLVERYRGAIAWDAYRAGEDPHELLLALGRPRRALGIARTLAWRRRVRRRSAEVTPA
jgi:glycosyltransferase involved in cell wall biosynthesis